VNSSSVRVTTWALTFLVISLLLSGCAVAEWLADLSTNDVRPGTEAPAYRAALDQFSATMDELGVRGLRYIYEDAISPNASEAAMRVFVEEFSDTYGLLEDATATDQRLDPAEDFLAGGRLAPEFREAGRVLRVRSRLRRLEGDHPGAARDAVRLVQLGTALSGRRTPSALLSAVGLDSIAVDELRRVIPKLGAREATSILDQLQDALEDRPSYAEVTRHDGLLHLKFMDEYRADLMAGLGDQEVPEDWPELDFERMRSGVALAYTRLNQEAREPLWKWQIPDPPSYPWSRTRVEFEDMPFGRTWFTTGYTLGKLRAELHLTMVALAAQAYRQHNGALPRSLKELTPRYIDEIPADPFTPGPLRARMADGDLTVYSVGPDGDDDDAAPLEGRICDGPRKTDGDVSMTLEAR
jgi:hypothetical protein